MTDTFEKFWMDDFAPLQAAGTQINAALRSDEQDDKADLYRRISSGNGPASHLYFSSQSFDTNKQPPPLQQLQHHKSIPLPERLEKQIKSVKYQSRMGLLAPAELAWVSVDEKLYLWSYNEATAGFRSPEAEAQEPPSFCSFTVPSGQCVAAVGLARPKEGKRLADSY